MRKVATRCTNSLWSMSCLCCKQRCSHLVPHPTCGCGLVFRNPGSRTVQPQPPRGRASAIERYRSTQRVVEMAPMWTMPVVSCPTTETSNLMLKHADAQSCKYAQLCWRYVLQLAGKRRDGLVSIGERSALLRKITALASSWSRRTHATHTWRTEANHCQSRLRPSSIHLHEDWRSCSLLL